jgi:hypothetical protein
VNGVDTFMRLVGRITAGLEPSPGGRKRVGAFGDRTRNSDDFLSTDLRFTSTSERTVVQAGTDSDWTSRGTNDSRPSFSAAEMAIRRGKAAALEEGDPGLARLAVVEETLGHLATMLARMDAEDGESEVAGDWRRVAGVADRCLFWVFLVITVVYTAVTMVFVPFFMQ